MNLVIKNQHVSAAEDAEKIYRDALVSDGTLVLVDFSNGGATFNKDLSGGVYDLARDAAEELGIRTAPEFLTKNTLPSLTDKDGLPMDNLGAFGPADFATGLNFHGIGKYLFDNQPNTLLTFWVELDNTRPDLGDGRIISTPDDSGVGNNIRVITPGVSATSLSANLAGKSTIVDLPLSNKLPTQISVEFIDSSTPNKYYVNGVETGVGGVSDGGFTEPTVNDVLSIGYKGLLGRNSMAIIYRLLIEDLTHSGREAIDVIEQDYQYVNGIGQYAGMPRVRRPFANLSI